MKILMVCLGNICRSPLAHGILESKTKHYGITVDSAGTGSYHIGEPPDPRSIEVAMMHQIDISDQRARQFQVSDFDEFDRIYAMDRANLRDLKNLARNPEDERKLRLFMDSDPESPFDEVPDPYYDEIDGFKTVYALIETTCKKINTELKDDI